MVAGVVGPLRRTVRLLGSRAGGGDRDGRDAVVAELLSAFAGRLSAGIPAADAFVRSAGDVVAAAPDRDWLASAEMVRLGASGPDALRASTTRPLLLSLAVAWRVTESTGAALGPVVARLAEAARADARHRRAVDAELAAVRASTRLLAALPAVGLLLGTVLGAAPVSFLLGTAPGRCCLLGAALMEWCGVRWTHAVADRARAGR
jgi:tight adherence protein B